MAVLDMVTTLRPEHGIARAVSVVPPDPPDHLLWTVAVDIGGLEASKVRGLLATDFPLHLVGACGPSRRDALVRGCGEAVERFALLNVGGADAVAGTAADIGETALHCWDDGLGAPGAADACLRWYEGRRLRTGGVVQVPAPLVDYPPTDENAARLFDPSPSGAASGQGYSHALRNALLEIVERDAVMSAWGSQAALPRVDADQALAVLPDSAAAREFARLVASARAIGLDLMLARIPTAVAGVSCVLCGVVDRSGSPLAAAGCRISPAAADGLAGALREALQVRSVLLGVRRQYAGQPMPPEVRGDLDRARFWAAAPACAAFESWSASWPVAEIEPDAAGARPEPPEPDVLVAALAADGADPVAVDLTHRLPEPLRDMGWAAAKVIAPGYQPLLIDERNTFVWCADRFGALARRLGVNSGDGPPGPDHQPRRPYPVPHPLI